MATGGQGGHCMLYLYCTGKNIAVQTLPSETTGPYYGGGWVTDSMDQYLRICA